MATTMPTVILLRTYVEQFSHLEERLTSWLSKGVEVSLLDELTGILVDERQFQPEANHIITDIVYAFMSQYKSSPTLEQIDGLKRLRKGFEFLLNLYEKESVQ